MHKPQFSLEVFPPKRNGPVGSIYDTLDGLQGVNPDFISVTYGTGKTADRTATARICHTVRKEYNIPVVAHLTAQYLDHAQVDEALDMFQQAGVKAVLALRGDVVEGREPAGVFTYASDLVRYIRQQCPDMPVYGACYPEVHPNSAGVVDELRHLKTKVDAGVSNLITQLFFDNDDFFRFVEQARIAGIDVPIEAGIMPVTNAAQVRRMVTMCGARIPKELSAMLERWGDDADAMRQAGVLYASQQIADLVSRGVDGVHLYTMNHPCTTRRIWANVSALFKEV
ncbi:methylenetetrahydrofolate reductase [NAD(P)H] [Alloscardovia sp. HMSC034E08]|uniref:methylenetetrahydrofolate reductase [NAD(P)H] n=1 Tax=Alloscardovia sp. HMSC034E08 TaxID=1739413 RepID=UPI0008BECECF|nr:methylenetetrahydrofolate reductase [NAD(P)H] [Alloscardovia sp. HMSC034E08]OFQ98215.1 methylenetetrahydrofolate reductase [NAD(P)H] [Alloscardovia sp. HMSC034E08]